MAKWWTINANWPVRATHSALSITPAAGFNRDRAATSVSSAQHLDGVQAITGVHRSGSGTGNVQPPAPSSSTRSRSIGVPVQHGLQQHLHIGRGDPGRGLHHHGLVELVGRAVHVVQPAHDRGGQHRPDALIDRAGLIVADPGHPGQPGHGLLNENVTRPAPQTRRPGPGHHLHRQDAVAAQVEERVIDPDPVQAQHLGVNPGQDLLDRAARGPVLIAGLVFGCRQGADIQLAVDRQRQPVEHHHRRRHHVGRQPLGQFGARRGGIDGPGECLGDIGHQACGRRGGLRGR